MLIDLSVRRRKFKEFEIADCNCFLEQIEEKQENTNWPLEK
jgi:hypothetical protein